MALCDTDRWNKKHTNKNNELTISTRGIEMPESPIRKLAPLAYKAEDEGVKIYRLNIGQPDLPTPQKALDALKIHGVRLL